jgi:hypothetical protein
VIGAIVELCAVSFLTADSFAGTRYWGKKLGQKLDAKDETDGPNSSLFGWNTKYIEQGHFPEPLQYGMS